ncbi:cytochrome c oxidase subunit II [Corynebacterium choanae]|uniref:Cytochrome c oxidase subunit 2 n=1 Tax=Corynebacterium choanae TaxID=1862358 RepID=A0A3G6JAN1_9CORY|nr:Cytochrome c oxidase subunit 2 precursor [Corynebacterium choanae]
MEHRIFTRLKKKALLTTALATGAMALAGCEVEGPHWAVFQLGWPDGITPEARAMENFWEWVWVAAWAIGIVMWGLMIYSIFAFSAKKAEKQGKDPIPNQLQYNVPLEIVLTTIPVVIVMTLFFFTVQTQDKVDALDKDPEVVVDVTAFQWNWKFGYREVTGLGAAADGQVWNGIDEERTATAELSKVDEAYREKMEKFAEERGVEPEDGPVNGRSKSDISYLHFNTIETLGTSEEVPVLVLPTETPIEFDLASADVSHSFWVPEFLFKRDAYPHPEASHAQRRFQVSKIEKEGAFVGRCAEMCGTYHAMMNFEIRAVSRDKFAEYMKFRIANPTAPNSEALKAIGEDPYATSTAPFVTGREDSRGVEKDGNYVELNETAR